MNVQHILDRPVLVLNKNWQAIDTETVEYAIANVYRGQKRALHLPTDLALTWDEWLLVEPAEGDLVLRTVRGVVVVPSVVVTAYEKMPKKMPRKNRQGIGRRDGYRCAYTDVYCPETGTLDHVVSRDQGGQSTWENLVWCSREVNAKKGNRTPAEAGLRLRRKPAKPLPVPASVLIEPKLPEWRRFLVHNWH